MKLSTKSYSIKTIVITIVVFCTLLITLGNQYLIQNQNLHKLQNRQKELEFLVDNAEDKTFLTMNKILNQFKSEHRKLNSQIKIWDSREKLLLSDMLVNRSKPIFIFRYSELQCQDCINAQIVVLKEFVNKVGSENVMILANYQYDKNLYLFKRMNQIEDINVYQVDSLNLDVEKLNVPYVFVLHNDMRTQFVFIPDKDFPELYIEYYNTIEDLFYR